MEPHTEGQPQSLPMTLFLSIPGKRRQLSRLIKGQNQLCPLGIEKSRQTLSSTGALLTSCLAPVPALRWAAGNPGKAHPGSIKFNFSFGKGSLLVLVKIQDKTGTFLDGHTWTLADRIPKEQDEYSTLGILFPQGMKPKNVYTQLCSADCGISAVKVGGLAPYNFTLYLQGE